MSKINKKIVDGCEEWTDSKGNVVYSKDILGSEEWNKWDKSGNLIETRNSYGLVWKRGK